MELRDYGLNERVVLEMEQLLHRRLTPEERRLLLLASEVGDPYPTDLATDDSAA